MKTQTAQLRLLSDDDLDQEFALSTHDDSVRTAILYERIRRLKSARSRSQWLQWTVLVAAVTAAFFAGIAAIPVIENLGESRWFDF